MSESVSSQSSSVSYLLNTGSAAQDQFPPVFIDFKNRLREIIEIEYKSTPHYDNLRFLDNLLRQQNGVPLSLIPALYQNKYHVPINLKLYGSKKLKDLIMNKCSDVNITHQHDHFLQLGINRKFECQSSNDSAKKWAIEYGRKNRQFRIIIKLAESVDTQFHRSKQWKHKWSRLYRQAQEGKQGL